MNIEYITSARLDETGAPRLHVLGVAAAFGRLGHRVIVVSPTPSSPIPAAPGVRHRHFPWYPVRGGWRLYETLVAGYLRTAGLRGTRADLYYFRMSPSIRIAKAMSRTAGWKAVEVNGLEVIRFPGMRSLLREADYVLVGSEEMRRSVVDIDGALSPKMRVQSNIGINPADAARIEKDVARKELGLPADAFIALAISGFQPQHDFETAFAALAEISGERRTMLLAVGQGPTKSAVESDAKKWLSRLDIRFDPPASGRALSRYLSAADVGLTLVSPAKLLEGNGKGQKTIEYLSHGLPVIESVRRELPMTPLLAKYAHLVDPADVPGVAEALREMRDHAAREKQRAEEARLQVLRDYSWDTIIKDFLDEAALARGTQDR